MNELQAFDFNGVDVVDSRQVAEMVGKRHDNLMRDIDSYLAIMRKPVNLLKMRRLKILYLPVGDFKDRAYSIGYEY